MGCVGPYLEGMGSIAVEDGLQKDSSMCVVCGDSGLEAWEGQGKATESLDIIPSPPPLEWAGGDGFLFLICLLPLSITKPGIAVDLSHRWVPHGAPQPATALRVSVPCPTDPGYSTAGTAARGPTEDSRSLLLCSYAFCLCPA